MSIAEDIALNVADLPIAPFDLEGPELGERELDERGIGEPGREGIPRTTDPDIADASPPTAAPASHPLLDGP